MSFEVTPEGLRSCLEPKGALELDGEGLRNDLVHPVPGMEVIDPNLLGVIVVVGDEVITVEVVCLIIVQHITPETAVVEEEYGGLAKVIGLAREGCHGELMNGRREGIIRLDDLPGTS